MDKGNENLVYLSPWDFKRSIGTSGFTSPLKEGVLLIFIALKNPFEPTTSGSSGKHTNHYTTKATTFSITQDYIVSNEWEIN
jgi:hypothetical protein